eukprot:1013785-Amphidinium_carterae.1
MPKLVTFALRNSETSDLSGVGRSAAGQGEACYPCKGAQAIHIATTPNELKGHNLTPKMA